MEDTEHRIYLATAEVYHRLVIMASDSFLAFLLVLVPSKDATPKSSTVRSQVEWIDSTIVILRRAKEYGFMIYMDPGSPSGCGMLSPNPPLAKLDALTNPSRSVAPPRVSGGSGAPMWTLFAMGLNPRTFDVTEAAMVHNTWPDPATFPKMIWSTNYQRLACQTIFTVLCGTRLCPQLHHRREEHPGLPPRPLH